MSRRCCACWVNEDAALEISIRVCVGAAAIAVSALCGAPAVAQEDVRAWAALRSGGHVILMRHAATERTNSGLTRSPGDCSKERNLSARGRAQAQALAGLLEAHGIVIAEVLASPYCRTRDTARLTFGWVSTWQPLELLETLLPASAEANTETVTARVREFRGPGNLALVTHEPNIQSLTFEASGFGEMLVLKPGGANGFEVVGRLAPPP